MNGYYLITLNGFKSKVNVCSLMRSCSFKDHIPEEREPVMFWTSSDQLSEVLNTRDTVRSSEWIRTTSTLFVSITVHHQSESGSDTFPFMEEVLIRFPSLLPTFMIFKFLQCWVKLSEYCSSSYDETAVVCGTDQLFPITTRPTLPRTQHSDCSVQPNECQINMESFSPLTLSP